MHYQLAAWLLTAFLAWVPQYHTDMPRYADAKETHEEQEARFGEIADALATVVLDPEERPLFSGKWGREKTAIQMASIAYYESHLARNVDYGLGKWGRGDYGGSWCMMQINLGRGRDGDSADRTPEGWSGKDLVADREKCFRAGLHKLRQSWGCGKGAEKLTVYASGRCITGTPETDKDRHVLAAAWYRHAWATRNWEGRRGRLVAAYRAAETELLAQDPVITEPTVSILVP
jgi:hypothetical protein